MSVPILALMLFGFLAFLIVSGVIVAFLTAPRISALTVVILGGLLLLGTMLIGVSARTASYHPPAPPVELQVHSATAMDHPPRVPSPPVITVEEAIDGKLVEAAPSDADSAAGSAPTLIRETEYRDGNVVTTREGMRELPSWIQHESTIEKSGDIWGFQLVSKRYATADEAREQLWNTIVRHELTTFLKRELPDYDGASLTLPEALKWGILKREVDATYPIEVGGFTEQVHQVHWEAEFNPWIREQLLLSWKPAIVKNRLLHLAAVLGGATLLFGAGALVSRRRNMA